MRVPGVRTYAILMLGIGLAILLTLGWHMHERLEAVQAVQAAEGEAAARLKFERAVENTLAQVAGLGEQIASWDEVRQQLGQHGNPTDLPDPVVDHLDRLPHPLHALVAGAEPEALRVDVGEAVQPAQGTEQVDAQADMAQYPMQVIVRIDDLGKTQQAQPPLQAAPSRHSPPLRAAARAAGR